MDNENKTENTVEFEKDSFVIDEGFTIQNDEKAGPQKKRRKKRDKKNAAKIAVTLILVFAIGITLAVTGIMFLTDYLGISGSKARDITVEIPRGVATSTIAERLDDEGVISHPLFFRVYSKIKGYDGRYQSGVYTFSKDDGYSAIAARLLNPGESTDRVRVTIPERASVDKIAEILSSEENFVCTKSDFYKALDKKSYEYGFVGEIPESKVYYLYEGYLFPDTYDFYCYDSEECAYLAVEKMLAQTEKVLLEENAYEKAKELGYTLHEVLTMASIVELEASGQPEEMASVAQVFYNRLEKWENPLLGSSPTAKYKYGSGRYNTNTNPGLPPGPYCSPSRNAIRAALAPNTECTATYFVTDASMNFYYTYSLQEHHKIINKLKAENNWIYETY